MYKESIYNVFLDVQSTQDADAIFDISDTNINMRALLQLAAEHGNATLIQWVISKDKNVVNQKSQDEDELVSTLTPLEIALEYHQEKCIAVLLNANAELSKTAIHRLFDLQVKLNEAESSDRCIGIITLLMARGIDQNERDRFGNTALHCAVSKFTPMAVIEYMVQQGADLFAKNALGDTVRDCASKTAKAYREKLLSYLDEQMALQMQAKSKEDAEQAAATDRRCNIC